MDVAFGTAKWHTPPLPSGIVANHHHQHQNISSAPVINQIKLEVWANTKRDGRPAEYRWRRLFNAAKFG